MEEKYFLGFLRDTGGLIYAHVYDNKMSVEEADEIADSKPYLNIMFMSKEKFQGHRDAVPNMEVAS